MYSCTHCHVDVEDDQREAHSASQTHQDNGGSATVVEADYELVTRSDRGGPPVKPTGTSKIR